MQSEINKDKMKSNCPGIVGMFRFHEEHDRRQKGGRLMFLPKMLDMVWAVPLVPVYGQSL